MTEYRDFYQILGISPKATPAEIKTAYRALARKYHPDTCGEEGTQDQFNAVTEAFRVLSNPELRNAYNKEHGHNYAQTERYDREQEIKRAEEKRDKNVFLAGEGISSEDAWKRLRNQAHDFDLKVGHKVALTPDEDLAEDSEDDSEYIAPWGEAEQGPSSPTYGGSGSVIKKMLGSFRKSKTKRELDKARLKRDLDAASIPLQPSDLSKYENIINPVDHTLASPAARNEDPFKGERVFQFQISPLEQALGCSREIALAKRPGDPPKKIRIQIPAGIENGKVLQIRKGWDAVKFKILVIANEKVFVRNLDILLYVPTTVKESLSGVTVSVPTLDASMHVSIPGGRAFASRIKFDGYGVHEEEARSRGDLYVQPHISLPDTETDALDEAIKSIGQKYSSDVRSRFDWKESFFPEIGNRVVTVPISIDEAFFGGHLLISSPEGAVSIDLPEKWFVKTPRLNVTDAQGYDLLIQPYVVAPDLIDEHTQSAASAIDDYNHHAVRDSLPRRLVQK